LVAALPMIIKIGKKYKMYFKIIFVEIFVEFILFVIVIMLKFKYI